MFSENMFSYTIIVILIKISFYCVLSDNYSYINLPQKHLSQYFNNFPQIREECENNYKCEYRNFLESNLYNRKICWGYEESCKKEDSFFKIRCPGDHIGFVKDKETQFDIFYAQTDFGYVRDQIREMTLICEPLFADDSSLECSKYLRFCRGRNLMFNFTDLSSRKEPIRYKMDVLKQGQIGGYCNFHKERLKDELEHISALQSWGPELRFFENFKEKPISSEMCDVIIEKPTILMKIDATVNMYHHFCDFINLYASLHVNMTHPHSFNTDNNILIWESYTYDSPFAETFKAFTQNPILDLKTFRGETVCFKNLLMPLLPRMVFGLYYNTPFISGCENSGLFHAFSEHILHRLEIPLHDRLANKKIRLTILSRETKYRRIMNEKELVDEISKDERFDVKRVAYGGPIKFKQQLEITRNTDVLVGMHGAGLTHLLFLPNWASVFELYNCEDPSCYKNLAHLRGVNYITWEDKQKIFPTEETNGNHEHAGHAKFTNYSFDVKEFVRLVELAAQHVQEHDEFQKFIVSESNVNHEEL